MKLVAGLGNPGKEYMKTRHNAGFMFLDYMLSHCTVHTPEWKQVDKDRSLIEEVIIAGEKVILLKPTAFMNDAGSSITSFMQWRKIEPLQFLLAHDDLDLELGTVQVCTKKAPKGHNGVASVENHLHTKDFLRCRIGIESRNELMRNRMPGMTYVLSRFSPDEESTLQRAFENALPKVLAWIEEELL